MFSDRGNIDLYMMTGCHRAHGASEIFLDRDNDGIEFSGPGCYDEVAQINIPDGNYEGKKN